MLAKVLWLLVASAFGYAGGLATGDLPVPVRFQGNTTVIVTFTDMAGIAKYCGVNPDKNAYIISCVDDIGGDHIFMRNPCHIDEVKDPNSYAKNLCHEIAHTHGWHHDDPL